MQHDTDIAAEIRRQTAALGSAGSISPDDVARALAPPGAEWRHRLPEVRRTALELAEAGEIEILRKGHPVATAAVRGVIRLRARAHRS